MILKRLLQVSAFIAILAVLLSVPAGRLDWVMGWAFIGVYVVGVLLTAVYVGRTNPDLIEERAQVKEGTKGWDRVLTNLFSLVALPGVMVVAGLDVRFGWSSFPMPVQLMALVFNGLGYGLVVWAMATNAFFATYVRIQTDRGHKVVTDGPYRFVRHPGYVGMITTALATPLMLGSMWALIPGGVGACVIVVCTALEDRTLQRELEGYKGYTERVRYYSREDICTRDGVEEGYKGYTERVRYRLLPGVW